MHPREYNIEITPIYWLGECYQADGWKRLTLFYKLINSQRGSISTPVAEINIVRHPGHMGGNTHHEIKFSVRNNIRKQGQEIIVDKNIKELRHPNDILDTAILDTVIQRLQESGFIDLPFSVYVCMEHVEDFKTYGDFWSVDYD